MATIVLSRFSITGALASDSPSCVVKEINDIHGESTSSITSNPTREELSLIARYVNPEILEWQPRTLLTAFKLLQFFMRELTLDAMMTKIGSGFKAGPQTPEDPLRLNCCVLYKVCVTAGIGLRLDTTLEQMATAVRLLFDEMGSLRRQLIEMIDTRRVTKPHMISLLMRVTASPDTETPLNSFPSAAVTHGMLESKIRRDILNVDYLRSIADVKTAPLAVALAAHAYEIDISRSSDPIREYYALRCPSYTPISSWMSHWWKANGSLFQLSKTFNPLYPADYYKNEKLREMALAAGITDSDIETSSAYDLLCKEYAAETFYEGKLPSCTGDCDLSYGIFEKRLVPVTEDELITLFSKNRLLKVPGGDGHLSNGAIRKLKKISERRANTKLLGLIRELEFRNFYFSRSQEEKDRMTRVLTLMDLIGTDTELEKIACALGCISDELSVMDSVCRLEFISLPLVRYLENGTDYISSKDEQCGLTIGGKLAFIAEGDETKESCINDCRPWMTGSSRVYLALLSDS